MNHTFVFSPASDPREGAGRIEESGLLQDIVLVAPSPTAHDEAAAAVGDRFVLPVAEPLLAGGPGGSGEDALAQLARAFRELGRLADDLERVLPIP